MSDIHIQRYIKKDFLEKLEDLLSSYTINSKMSTKEMAIAYSPARILNLLLSSFYALAIEENSTGNSTLSCKTKSDLSKVLEIVEKVSLDFSYNYGSLIYKMFNDELKKETFDDSIVVEYIMPLIITSCASYLLSPTIKSSDDYISSKIRIDIKPLH